jgi:hypothetical protein
MNTYTYIYMNLHRLALKQALIDTNNAITAAENNVTAKLAISASEFKQAVAAATESLIGYVYIFVYIHIYIYIYVCICINNISIAIYVYE